MAAKRRVSAVLRAVREEQCFGLKVEKAARGKGSYSRKGRSARNWEV